MNSFEINSNPGQCQRVAQGDQFAGFLGRHDAGDAGNAQHVAFLAVPDFNDRQRGGQHFNAATGDADAVRGGLAGHIHHVGLALGVEMGEGRYGNSSRVVFETWMQRVPNLQNLHIELASYGDVQP